MNMDELTLDTLIAKKEIIFSYLRNIKGNKVGMLVAWKHNEKVFISYSLLNPGDEFNKLQGIQEAIDKSDLRRNSTLLSTNKVFNITYKLSHFIHRCAQYFKTSDFSIHVPIIQRKMKNAETSSKSQ